ncbi:hypothetical protein IscW_ISCW018286, partial [Ixodes scapularis]
LSFFFSFLVNGYFTKHASLQWHRTGCVAGDASGLSLSSLFLTSACALSLARCSFFRCLMCPQSKPAFVLQCCRIKKNKKNNLSFVLQSLCCTHKKKSYRLL